MVGSKLVSPPEEMGNKPLSHFRGIFIDKYNMPQIDPQRITNLENNVSLLQTDVANLTMSMTSISSKIANMTVSIAALESLNIPQIKLDVSNLKSDLTILTAIVHTLLPTANTANTSP